MKIAILRKVYFIFKYQDFFVLRLFEKVFWNIRKFYIFRYGTNFNLAGKTSFVFDQE